MIALRVILRQFAARFTGRCDGILGDVSVCDLHPGHGGRHRGRAGRHGWAVDW